MDSFHLIWLATIVLAVSAQIVMFSLQAIALRRYGHKCFWLLCAGSACVGIYAIVGAIPYFVAFNKSGLTDLWCIGLAIALVGVVFGVWVLRHYFIDSVSFKKYQLP